MYFYNLHLLLYLAPALILAAVAQWMVHSAYARARQMGAGMSGFAAARRILDSAELWQVGIEEVPGQLSDHYDPRVKILRLSSDVYHGRSLAAVGIAAHEAGHALQDAHRYPLLIVRNAAVPIANLGSGAGMFLLMMGLVAGILPLCYVGLVLFGGVVFFQLVNLPVEFDASARAKALLVDLGIVAPGDMPAVRSVLNAAALTYVAATLQSVLTLMYYASRFTSRSERE